MKAQFFLAALAVIIITSCQQNKKDQVNTSVQSTEKPLEKASPKANKFDLSSIPLSDKNLGNFPYISLPEGYANMSNNPVTENDKAYFWTGDHFEQPAGKIFFSRVIAEGTKTYSETELLKGIDDTITSLGGVKISEGKISADTAASIDEANKVKYISGYGFIGYATTYTYLIRQADKNVWIQITPTDDGASVGWIILEAKV